MSRFERAGNEVMWRSWLQGTETVDDLGSSGRYLCLVDLTRNLLDVVVSGGRSQALEGCQVKSGCIMYEAVFMKCQPET